jgi:glycine cleavage system H protein
MPHPTDLKYTKDHEWVRLSGDIAEVGITDFAQRQLGDVVYVDLPAVGTTIGAGAVFGTIESVKAVSELFAPVSGEVTDVNSYVTNHPDVVNTAPHDTWLIKMRVTDQTTVAALLDSTQYEALLA